MLNPPAGVQTQDYIDALKSDSLVHVRMSFAAQGITLTDQDIMAEDGLTLSDILNGDIDLTFGRAVMKQLTVGVINSSRVADLLWTDEFTLELGVDINSVTKWVKIGEFVGQRPNNISNVSVIEYTAYDKMQKFDTLADDFWNSVTFPATVSDIYHDLCTYVGIGYVSGDELPYIMSRTFTTAPMQLQGYTCRDLLAWISEACGCYAKVNADGNCKMVWYTDHSSSLAFALDDEFHIETADIYTGLIWDEFDEYFWNDADKLTWNDVCSYEEVYGVDSIQVRQFDSDININYPYATGGNVYMIIENPFLSVESSDDIDNYIKPLWDRLTAFGGRLPLKVDCVGNWLVEAGDIISVDVNDSYTINTPVYVKTMHWNGSCRDTYETTGEVWRQEVSSTNREKLISRNNIRFVAKDLYYGRQSGVDITPEGVEITGSKYLKLKSGGILDVQSENFELNSAEKRMKSGDWQFDNSGMLYLHEGEPIGFEISKFREQESNTTGLFYEYVDLGGGLYVGRILVRICADLGGGSLSRGIFIIGEQIENGAKSKYIVPYVDQSDPHNSYIGTSSSPFNYGFMDTITGGYFRSRSGENLKLIARSNGHSADLQIREAVSDGKQYIYILKGNTVDHMIFYGDVVGSVKHKSTTETNFNNIKENGTYWVSLTNMSNRPNGLTSGTYLLEVFEYSSSHVTQRITTGNTIYVRMLYSGSWGAWYKFTGTAS